MMLKINALCVLDAGLSIGLVFSGIVVVAKKAKRRHEEGEKKGSGQYCYFYFCIHNKCRQVALLKKTK